MIVSAFGPKAAAIAGKHGQGLWTLGDPESAPEVIEAYRKACRDNGKEVGEIVLQAGFALGDVPEDRYGVRLLEDGRTVFWRPDGTVVPELPETVPRHLEPVAA